MVNAFVASLFLITGVGSQATICVWNSVDTWDHINGEYVQQNDLWNTHPYWQSISNSCNATYYYIFASWYAPDSAHFWLIHPSLVSDYQLAYPDCENQPISADPTICPGGYFEWYSSNNKIELPLTITSGSCPSLQCDRIQVTGITIPSHTICNKIFTRNSQQRNVFVHSDHNSEIYLYFNQYTFKWYCSDRLGMEECGDDASIHHAYVSSLSDGWMDLAVGDSATITMSNNEDATFQCLTTVAPTRGPTQATAPPTHNPTLGPSQAPSQASGAPTVGPTNAAVTLGPTQPTVSPTQNPTRAPTPATAIPTRVPSQVTTAPTQNPTRGPTPATGTPTTDNPTGSPSEYPTNVPTLRPTDGPTNTPSNNPTTVPTMAPVQSILTSDYDSNEEGGKRISQKLQMTSTEHVDTTALAVAIVMGGIFCIATIVMACVLWAKHEKAHRPIYMERKKQMLVEATQARIMKLEQNENEECKPAEAVNNASTDAERGPKKKTSILLSQCEVQLQDLQAGDMYEAQDGDVQFGAL